MAAVKKEVPEEDSPWALENGPFRMLYEMMPLRMTFALEHSPYVKGLKVLDLGCGGGLMSRAFASLGAHVVAVDQCEKTLLWAQSQSNPAWRLVYVQGNIEHEVPKGPFDIILAMEVLEHVRSPYSLIKKAWDRLKEGGAFIGSTLNRSFASYALGIVAAEYVLKWVPRGTHQWEDFITPRELKTFCLQAGFHKPVFQGVVRDVFQKKWKTSSSLKVNYFFAACKQKALPFYPVA